MTVYEAVNATEEGANSPFNPHHGQPPSVDKPDPKMIYPDDLFCGQSPFHLPGIIVAGNSDNLLALEYIKDLQGGKIPSMKDQIHILEIGLNGLFEKGAGTFEVGVRDDAYFHRTWLRFALRMKYWDFRNNGVFCMN